MVTHSLCTIPELKILVSSPPVKVNDLLMDR